MSDVIFPVALPTVKGDDEEYATPEELDSADDLIECDVRLDWWRNGRGRPRVLRVRALSSEDEAQIELVGRAAATEYKRQNPSDWRAPDRLWFAEYVAVLERGVIRPQLTRAQAEKLLKKNARAIEELVRFIRALSGLDRATLAALAVQSDALIPPIVGVVPARQEETSEPSGPVTVAA